MAALAAGNWLSTPISGRRGHSGEMPEQYAVEFLSRHADQPGATVDLRGGWLSGPKGASHR